MSEFKIEKNVTMPTPRVASIKYPFGKMAVGDSFSFPTKDRRRIATASTSYGRAHGWKFAIRDSEDGTCRCWRIA